jgi:copper transport protein
VATTPASDAVLADRPAQVTLRFSEPVEAAFGSVRVFDADTRRVDDGRTTRPSSSEVAVGIDGTLPDGTYTVAWRAVSADSHPVHGAFVFHIGKPGTDPDGVAAEVTDEEGSSAVSGAFSVVRFVSVALILLTAGGAAALALWVPASDAASTARRRLWAVLTGCAVALVPVTLAAIGLQGAGAAGLGLDAAARWSLFSEVLETRYGQVAVARIVLAAVVAALAAVAWRGRSGSQPLALVACALGALLAVTPSLAGHAQVQGSIAVLSDAVHVEAAALWAGGLAFLVLLLAWARGSRWEVATEAVPVFSGIALLAVCVLLVAGVVNGLYEVGSWAALWETTYGRLLLAKVALVLPLLGLGAYNNRVSVPRLRSADEPAVSRRRLLRTTGVELALLVVVVAVTAALVAEPPARGQPDAELVAVSTEVGPYDLDLVVDPGQPGDNELHLYLLEQSGQPADVDEANVSASLRSASIGPLRFEPVLAGPGHYVVPRASFPFAGTWQVGIDVRKGDFDSWSTYVEITIGKE